MEIDCVNGSCSDEIICSLLGGIVTINTVGIVNKVLNQKRALWLTPEEAKINFVTNSVVKV